MILGLLRLNEIHQVGVEGSLFDFFPIWALLADPAQPHDFHLAVDVDPTLVPSEATEAAALFIVGITKSPIVDSISIDAIER